MINNEQAEGIEIDVNVLSKCLIPMICPNCNELDYPPSGSETCLSCWVQQYICDDCIDNLSEEYEGPVGGIYIIQRLADTLAVSFPPYEQLCTEECIVCFMANQGNN